MTTLQEILIALGFSVNLDHLYEFDGENLLNEGFKQLDEITYQNHLIHRIFEIIVIKKNKKEIDILLNGTRLADNYTKIDYLKKLYSLFNKDLNLTQVDLDNYHEDYNDVLEDINFSIGIHLEIINFSIRITLKQQR